MPFLSEGAGDGGGGGLHFRRPADEFVGASLAACRTSRDAYFGATANAAALREFQGDQSLAIILNPTSATDNTFETYLPSTGAYDATQWRERTDAIEGNIGSQGRFEIIIHANATSAPATPTGGSYDTATGTLTPPTGWTEAPTVPGTGEDVYASQAVIDPETQSGTVTPAWSVPVERSHLSSGISHVETSADFTGAGTPSDVLGLANPITPNPSDAPTEVLLSIKYGSTVYNVDEVLDVTDTGLPVLTEANHRSLFIDFDTPRVWIGHRIHHARVDAMGTFSDYSSTGYLGALSSAPGTTTVGQSYYDTSRHAWYSAPAGGISNVWRQTALSSLISGGRWLGELADDTTAGNSIVNFVSSNTYVYYNPTAGTIRVLDSSTYGAPQDPSVTYQVEPISAPGGIVSAITGLTAGAGLSGGGTSGVVSVAVDVTAVDFPTIPIDKGGTGATDAAAARVALGLSAGGGGAIDLGVSTATSDRLTVAAPSGYSHYPDGTLLLFKASYGQLDPSWTGSLKFYIGTDRYDFYGPGTSNLTYSHLVADTYYLAVVDSAVQLIGPIELPKREIGDRAFSNPPSNLTDTEKTAVRTAVDAPSIADVLAQILAGTGVTIDTSTQGQITLGAAGGGFTLLTGTGVPASTLGADNDWYLRTSNGAMYQKGSGAWSLIYTDQVGQAGTGITESAANTLIQDALEAAVQGNTETGIAVTYNADGTIDFVVGATPAQTHTNYVGIIDGALSAVTAADFTVSGVTGALTVPTYSGTRRMLFARPSAESDPTAVYLYQTGNRNTINQIGVFVKSLTTISLGGEAHNWWGTTDPQSGLGGYVLEQVN